MVDSVSDRLRTQSLSASSLKQITKMQGSEWSDTLVNEFINYLNNIALVASGTDSNGDQINENTQNIASNANGIANNTVLISQNSDLIALNADAIVIVSDNLNAHVISNSEHGVTGENVGTEDFCTDLIGGVVLLSALVNEAIDSTAEITIADLLPAPAAYDQAYTQLQSDLINDTKAKHNQLLLDLNAAISQFNELIANMKTANQMSVV